ncbi:hypothetical protein MKW98_027456, partial [Papaver atlanticum]
PLATVVAVDSTFVKKCQGKYTLSSTNATKLYFNLDELEVQRMRESVVRAYWFLPQRNKVPHGYIHICCFFFGDFLEEKWELPRDTQLFLADVYIVKALLDVLTVFAYKSLCKYIDTFWFAI